MSHNSTQGLIIVNTGDGKGKSTAAFGQLFRALGAGLNCEVYQFIKKQKSSEIKLLEKYFPEPKVHITGLGFTWNSQDLSEDSKAAQEGWEKAKKALSNPSLDLIVLDELTYPMNYNMIDCEEVYNSLKNRPSHQHVIITGRDANNTLIELTDTVTKMVSIKHHYDSDTPSQRGLEF